jgi:DNA topoisomerase IB
MPRLRRSDCASPGYSRRGRGRGFEYRDRTGARLEDADALARIAALAIPPAWREVWICRDPLGHLQATGIDAAGRKQYLYHERWRAHRDRLKFASMVRFAAALPRLRRRVRSDLRGRGLTRVRVLALSVRLLDLGFFRIGSEDYVESGDSYGLTTMQLRHVAIAHGEVVFDYRAKSGKRRVQAIADDDALGVVRALRRRPGSKANARLLAYRDGRTWHDVNAEEVNAYIKRGARGDYTAKDFRTWNATVLAAVALAARAPVPAGAAARERAVRAAIETVSEYLGNTPAVCRASYVDPRLIDRFHSGQTIAPALERASGGPDLGDEPTRRRVERAVLELLG